MERKEGEIINLSDLEMDLLDEIYFVTSFHEITEELEKEPVLIKKALDKLIRIGYIYQMSYDETKNDFEKNDTPDYIFMEKYSYLASKRGLFAHNTIR